MSIKNIKGIVFYAIITLIIAVSIMSDSKAWSDREKDIKNTLGPPPQVSTKVEEFEVTNMKGSKIKPLHVGEGPIMVILWSMDEDGRNKLFFDTLSSLIEEGKCSGFKVIPINIGNRREEVKKFFESNNYDFEYYFDSGKTTKWAFNRSKPFPMVYIINSDGVIRLRQEVGKKSYNENFVKRLAQYD